MIGDILDDLAGIHADFIRQHSTVTLSTLPGPTVVTGVPCVIQALSPEEMAAGAAEGRWNANKDQPMRFEFVGDQTGIVESRTEIIWDGWYWRILGVTPTPGRTVHVNQTVVGVRSKRVA